MTSLLRRSLTLSAFSFVGDLATHLAACVPAYASLSSYQHVCHYVPSARCVKVKSNVFQRASIIDSLSLLSC